MLSISLGHHVYRAALIVLAENEKAATTYLPTVRFVLDFFSTRRQCGPLTPRPFNAVILSKEPMYNHIVDNTILHSGPRSSLLTHDNRRIVATYMDVNVPFVEDDSLIVAIREASASEKETRAKIYVI